MKHAVSFLLDVVIGAAFLCVILFGFCLIAGLLEAWADEHPVTFMILGFGVILAGVWNISINNRR